MTTLKNFLEANHFAAKAHKGQLRKGALKLPYFCHPLEVANILARAGYSEDYAVLSAAMLHDVVEDCNVRPADLAHFGPAVVSLVNELTFINLTKPEKIARAPLLSEKAAAIKTADLISNINGITEDPTAMDSFDALRYVKYAIDMVEAFPVINPYLAHQFALAVHRFTQVYNPQEI